MINKIKQNKHKKSKHRLRDDDAIISQTGGRGAAIEEGKIDKKVGKIE